MSKIIKFIAMAVILAIVWAILDSCGIDYTMWQGWVIMVLCGIAGMISKHI